MDIPAIPPLPPPSLNSIAEKAVEPAHSVIKMFAASTQAQETNADQSGRKNGERLWETVAAEDIALNWDKSFPFQFVLVYKVGDGYLPAGADERFTLPIPPQNMSMSTPFAISTTVTLGGIVEEHNGAPLRSISLQGTTGVLPLRKTVDTPSKLESSVASIFAGTVTAARQIGTVVGDGSVRQANIVYDTDLGSDGLRGTGFGQFQLLKRFLEIYVARKKRGETNLHLGFAVWKEKEIYLVTPVSFDVVRSASSPLEYPYNINLRAWGRFSASEAQGAGKSYEIAARSPNVIAGLLNKIEAGRRVLEGIRSVLQGIRADIQQVLYTPLRQASLFCKDITGTVLAAVDFPTDVIKDFQEPILELAGAIDSVKRLQTIGLRFENNAGRSTEAVVEAFRQLAISSGKADHGAGHAAESVVAEEDQGNHAASAARALGGIPTRNQGSPALKAMDNPLDNYEFFASLQPHNLNLRPATLKKMFAETQLARKLRREDFEQFRDDTLRVLADFSDSVGAGNAVFTATYNLPIRTTNREPTDTEWDIIHTLSSLAQQYDSLAASSRINRDTVTSLDYVAGLAEKSGIAFKVPKSKFAVPFPYGHTLEQISSRYLGTPDRWHEIAALNGLRAPYVDELGFRLSLLATGNGNQILVADGSGLYVGQKVWLSSSNVSREARRIQKVEILGAGQCLVLVDGEPDLNKFNLASAPFLETFLSGTVNSQMQLYIPSDQEPLEIDYRVKNVPGIDYYDPLVRSGGIDLLLTQEGDLIITPDGDSRLAIGLNNLVQKVKLALGTPRGALLHHPDYGIGLIPGSSTADLSANTVMQNIKQYFKSDSGFMGVQSVSVQKDAGSLRVFASIGIAGTSQYVPIQVDIRG